MTACIYRRSGRTVNKIPVGLCGCGKPLFDKRSENCSTCHKEHHWKQLSDKETFAANRFNIYWDIVHGVTHCSNCKQGYEKILLEFDQQLGTPIDKDKLIDFLMKNYNVGQLLGFIKKNYISPDHIIQVDSCSDKKSILMTISPKQDSLTLHFCDGQMYAFNIIKCYKCHIYSGTINNVGCKEYMENIKHVN